MKIKLQDAIRYNRSLQRLKDKKLPVKLLYAVIKNMEIIEKEVDGYEKTRLNRCRQLAVKDISGNPVTDEKGYVIPEEDLKNLINEMDELLQTEINLSLAHVDIDVLEKTEHDTRYDILSVAELQQIEFMFTDDKGGGAE